MPHDDSPFAAPGADTGHRPNDGDYAIGFLGGFLCGCIGLIFVLATATGERTRQGAWLGFAVQLALGLVWNLFGALMLGD